VVYFSAQKGSQVCNRLVVAGIVDLGVVGMLLIYNGLFP